MSESITTEVSLAAASAKSKVTSLLSPTGLVGSTVGDILAVASDVGAILNTANTALSDLVTVINDPIQVSFSQGQPYSGTFITAPTIDLMPIQLTEQALSSSTATLSQLACGQIAALAERVGFEILNDSGLAQAMAYLFNEASSIVSLAFSIVLDAECLCGCNEITPYTYETYPPITTCAIPSITVNPNMVDVTAFITVIAGQFPNTVNIEGIVLSVWVDGLSVSVSSNGTVIAGVPQNINSGSYSDITTQANALIPAITAVTIVDYSHQQNLLNVTLALAIDNGLTTVVTGIMGSSLVTPVSFQVIRNRLNSVAVRGDAVMLLALIDLLGVNNVPNALSLVSALLAAIEAVDIPSGGLNGSYTSTTIGSSSNTLGVVSTIFQAGGITINTSANSSTFAQLITAINAILAALGITIQQVYNQNTCSSVFCSQNLLNVPMIKASNTLILEALLGTSTVQMANMFA